MREIFLLDGNPFVVSSVGSACPKIATCSDKFKISRQTLTDNSTENRRKHPNFSQISAVSGRDIKSSYVLRHF